jgi:hypothetical protein
LPQSGEEDQLYCTNYQKRQMLKIYLGGGATLSHELKKPRPTVTKPSTALADKTSALANINNSLTAGDFIVLNTNDGTAGQSAWVTYTEI